MTLTLNADGSITKDGIRYVPEPAKAERGDLAEEMVFPCELDGTKFYASFGNRTVSATVEDGNRDNAVTDWRNLLRHYAHELVRRADNSFDADMVPNYSTFRAAILSQIKDTTP